MKIKEIAQAYKVARQTQCERLAYNEQEIMEFLERLPCAKTIDFAEEVIELLNSVNQRIGSGGLEITTVVIVIAELLKEHRYIVEKLQEIPELHVQFK